MIGEAQDTLGKAATSEGRKQQHEQEPGQELERLEEENEHRIESLDGKISYDCPIAVTLSSPIHRRRYHFQGSRLPREQLSQTANHLGQLTVVYLFFCFAMIGFSLLKNVPM